MIMAVLVENSVIFKKVGKRPELSKTGLIDLEIQIVFIITKFVITQSK